MTIKKDSKAFQDTTLENVNDSYNLNKNKKVTKLKLLWMSTSSKRRKL